VYASSTYFNEFFFNFEKKLNYAYGRKTGQGSDYLKATGSLKLQ